MNVHVEASSTEDDLKLQKVDNSVFFGPCGVLTQPILLQYENIKFIIGVNLTTEKGASFYTQYFRHSNSLMVNLDISTAATENSQVELYVRNNTILLQKIVGQYLQMGKMRASLSQPQIDTIQSLPQFCNSNVLTGGLLVQYQAFNDLLTLFKLFGHFGNILVVSSHSHDSTLIKFLISTVITYHPFVTILEALQYMKAILDLPINASDEFDIINDRELQEFSDAQKLLRHRQTCSSKRRCRNLPENTPIDNKILMSPVKRNRF
ncbi:uncharacterized protein SKDI_01G0330 [Saccharomyces kudriavzevii IFO 1802]|uniref:Uncharacterized protein n=2 Tax=Saccharomyces kudriavzevii (strain ATCC MYA-4449 / AS 2.2408 / CBS 8840 / NBRC 1802 / NCYC 2889) TaxID=226230 RepID=A0AA35JA51_SACK1|nr:uncharacterized protein SKDI_01G0330 [Saccharomyces kudriavzevii IFO 1802]EJT43451.1 YAL037W-like protein [Saccharomyces kudriavzevii IFO 1802]CAI4054474.1 hypothetical protein SKDI_01G0330 [Saccharomyces kudriavzevii IFO 1802]